MNSSSTLRPSPSRLFLDESKGRFGVFASDLRFEETGPQLPRGELVQKLARLFRMLQN
jgi:hypothetical protein